MAAFRARGRLHVMKTRTLILLLLTIGIPLGLLTWAAQRIARNEQVVLRQQFSTLMEDRLRDINRSIARYFEETEAHLQQMTELDHPDPALCDVLRAANLGSCRCSC